MNYGAAPPKQLLIVYHSATGATKLMADAVREGAMQAIAEDGKTNLAVRLLHAAQVNADDVLAAQAYVFATPENLAAMSGQLKDFFDRTYYPMLERLNGRAYACVVCAGSDGHNAARQIARIATGWRLRAVSEPLIVCTHAQTPDEIQAPKMVGKQLTEADLARGRELGAALAAGLALGIY